MASKESKEIIVTGDRIPIIRDKKSICANKNCKNYNEEAIMKMYPMSVWCTLMCKQTDSDFTHRETYGD